MLAIAAWARTARVPRSGDGLGGEPRIPGPPPHVLRDELQPWPGSRDRPPGGGEARIRPPGRESSVPVLTALRVVNPDQKRLRARPWTGTLARNARRLFREWLSQRYFRGHEGVRLKPHFRTGPGPPCRTVPPVPPHAARPRGARCDFSLWRPSTSRRWEGARPRPAPRPRVQASGPERRGLDEAAPGDAPALQGRSTALTFAGSVPSSSGGRPGCRRAERLAFVVRLCSTCRRGRPL